ncbi:MAG TPA: alpha/beta hydrolase [Crinalium sp.]|jgi:hypothetical protein
MAFKHVYIIHGYNASPHDHWFPWLKEKLIADGATVSVLTLPNSENPSVTAWQNHLRNTISPPNQNTFFVAHSLGCLTLLQYLDALGKDTTIGGFIFVSGFLGLLKALPQLDGFLTAFRGNFMGFQPERIIRLTPNRTIVGSLNDSLVPYEQTEKLSRVLQTRLLKVSQGGHFLASDGITELPLVYDELTQMMGGDRIPSLFEGKTA